MTVRPLTILCVVYIVLVFYASLMPFDLVADGRLAREHFDRAVKFWPLGHQLHASRTDLMSNFLLYVPIGLLVACRWNIAGGRTVRAAIGAAAVAAGVSLSVEALQLLSLRRVSGVHDVTANVLGGLVGAAVGAAAGPRAWKAAAAGLADWWRHRPVRVLALAVGIMLAAEALSPFLPTLDVSTVWGNVKRSTLNLAAGMSPHPWDYWLVRRVGVYAAWTLLLGWSISPRRGRRTWPAAAALGIGFAAAAEVAKLLVVSRSANVANVLTAGCGAVAGAAAGAAGLGRLARAQKIALGLALLAVYTVHLEWSPFQPVWDMQRAADKLPRGMEWLPLYHYAMGGRLEDIRLFAQTVILTGAIGYGLVAADWGGARRPATAAATMGMFMGLLGLLLEAGQLLLPTRTPSVTDVFCFALGGALGGYLARRVPLPPAESPQPTDPSP